MFELNNKWVLPYEEKENVEMILDEYHRRKNEEEFQNRMMEEFQNEMMIEYMENEFKKGFGITIKRLLKKAIYWVEFRRGIGDH